MYAVYFAPRGKKRLLSLGNIIAQRHLSAEDNLIGFIGDAGAGKSLLIKGMFPGLELSNDDEGLNVRPLPILKNEDNGFFSSHTYHIYPDACFG
jgi:predicted GTPase